MKANEMLKSKESPKATITDVNKIMGKSANRKIWPFIGAHQVNEEPIIYPLNELPARPRPLKTFLPEAKSSSRTELKNQNLETFHRAIGPILSVAQVFGLLPLAGLRQASPKKLSFILISMRTFYALIIIASFGFLAVTALVHMVRTLNTDSFGTKGGIAAATAGAVFYFNSLAATVIFMWLAPKWVILQKEWRAMERQIDSGKQSSPRLRWKFRVIIIVVMIPALIEHILSLINNIPTDELTTNTTDITWREYLQLYSYKSHAFILSSYNYSLALGLFLFIISKIATFTWNFTDLFIMLVSTGLAERYKSLNQSLFDAATADLSTLDWQEYRRNYSTISSLVKRIDNDISPVILLSFANNLYFICLQLLNGFSPSDTSVFTSIYYFGSFGFLVGRTVAVTLLTARINDQSRMALPVLFNCPASHFTVETQRLQLQLTTDDVALTGLRFFSITRNFMLAVAGAIVTYEVVLLQFNVAMNK